MTRIFLKLKFYFACNYVHYFNEKTVSNMICWLNAAISDVSCMRASLTLCSWVIWSISCLMTLSVTTSFLCACQSAGPTPAAGTVADRSSAATCRPLRDSRSSSSVSRRDVISGAESVSSWVRRDDVTAAYAPIHSVPSSSERQTDRQRDTQR